MPRKTHARRDARAATDADIEREAAAAAALDGPGLGLRRSRLLAAIALMLQITAALPFLDWWAVTSETSGLSIPYSQAGLWGRTGEIAHAGAVWLTTALAIVPVAILFVRLAGASWRHEPKAWRRDLAIAAALMLGALASCLAWPREFPFFWGGATWAGNETTEPVGFAGMPGLGWWVAVLALLLTLWALWSARAKDDESGRL